MIKPYLPESVINRFLCTPILDETKVDLLEKTQRYPFQLYRAIEKIDDSKQSAQQYNNSYNRYITKLRARALDKTYWAVINTHDQHVNTGREVGGRQDSI